MVVQIEEKPFNKGDLIIIKHNNQIFISIVIDASNWNSNKLKIFHPKFNKVIEFSKLEILR